MKATVTVLNKEYSADESLAIAQHHGGDDGDGMPDEIVDAVNASTLKWSNIEGGDWIVVCDGEVKSVGPGVNPVIVES